MYVLFIFPLMILSFFLVILFFSFSTFRNAIRYRGWLPRDCYLIFLLFYYYCYYDYYYCDYYLTLSFSSLSFTPVFISSFFFYPLFFCLRHVFSQFLDDGWDWTRSCNSCYCFTTPPWLRLAPGNTFTVGAQWRIWRRPPLYPTSRYSCQISSILVYCVES
jgi:hypothetical protein